MIRTTKPGKGNKYFIRKANGGYSTCIQGKPTDKDCNVLANCVGYACGAANEELGLGYEKYHLNCNAENFIERAIASGLSVVKKPVVGGILVWQKGATLSGSDGAGHVAICTWVDNVDNPKVIKTAESGYGSKAFWTATRKIGNGNWGQASSYKYRGCIVIPVKPEPTPTPVLKYNVGDKVIINGTLYGNADGGKPGRSVKDKHTTITRKVEGKPYPYNTTGDLGWVAESQVKLDTPSPKTNFKIGDYVVPTKLVDYKGTRLIRYDDKYQIIGKDKRGNMLGAVRGTQRPIWAILPDSNIKKVG